MPIYNLLAPVMFLCAEPHQKCTRTHPSSRRRTRQPRSVSGWLKWCMGACQRLKIGNHGMIEAKQLKFNGYIRNTDYSELSICSCFQGLQSNWTILCNFEHLGRFLPSFLVWSSTEPRCRSLCLQFHLQLIWTIFHLFTLTASCVAFAILIRSSFICEELVLLC